MRKKKKGILHNEEGSAAILMQIFFAVIIMIAIVVAFQLAPVIGYQVEVANSIPGITTATGTFTYTANVSNGEVVNITNGAAVYHFEFNTTNLGLASICRTTDCILVNLSGVGNYTYNQSVFAANNLTTAINANASTSTIVTAVTVNASNITTLTSVNSGSAGAGYVLSDNAVGITSSGMTGGSDGSQWNATTNTNLVSGSSLWGTQGGMLKATATIGIAAIALVALFGIFASRREQGGGGAGGL